MALVSGRPISFQMDLYSPLYVRRPVVIPELFQSLNPVAYSGSMEESSRLMAATRGRAGVDLADRSYERKPVNGPMAGAGGFGGGRFTGKDTNAYGLGFQRELKEQMQLGGSVSSAASFWHAASAGL